MQNHKHGVWALSLIRYSIYRRLPLYFQLLPHPRATFSISISSPACFLPSQSPILAYLPLFQSLTLGLVRDPSAAPPHHLRPPSLTIPHSLSLSLSLSIFSTAVRLKVLTQCILLRRRHYGLWPDSALEGFGAFFFPPLLFSEKAISLGMFSMANGTTTAISQAGDFQALVLF